MGACSSSEGGGAGGEIDSEEEARHSKSIDKLIREDEKRLGREVKVRSLFPPLSPPSSLSSPAYGAASTSLRQPAPRPSCAPARAAPGSLLFAPAVPTLLGFPAISPSQP